MKRPSRSISQDYPWIAELHALRSEVEAIKRYMGAGGGGLQGFRVAGFGVIRAEEIAQVVRRSERQQESTALPVAVETTDFVGSAERMSYIGTTE